MPHGICVCMAVGGWLMCCEAVPCLQESKGWKEGKALLHSKGAFPCYEEGVSLHQRRRFLVSRKCLRQLERIPQSRDRRPRLSA